MGQFKPKLMKSITCERISGTIYEILIHHKIKSHKNQIEFNVLSFAK